jgi:site-specific DNA recombinase
VVEKEITRIGKSIDKILDAYQEGLIRLEELRKRMPGLRKRQEALKAELNSLEVAAASHQGFLRLADNMADFLGRLRKTADSMSVSDRQKIVRLVVKEILVDLDTIKIKHSIPVSEVSAESGPEKSPEIPSYLLRSWSHHRPLRTTFAQGQPHTLIQHSCFQPFSDEAEDPFISDTIS